MAARVRVRDLVSLVVPYFLTITVLVVLGFAVAERGAFSVRANVDELISLARCGKARVENDEKPEDERDDTRGVQDVRLRVGGRWIS